MKSGFARLTQRCAKRLLMKLETKNIIALIATGFFVFLVGGQSDLITLIQFSLIVLNPKQKNIEEHTN